MPGHASEDICLDEDRLPLCEWQRSVMLHWDTEFKVCRRVQFDCFSSTFAGTFFAREHPQRGLRLLEVCNYLS